MTDSLPEYLVLDPKLDRLPRAELRALQSQRLRTMVSYCYERTPFWRRKFDTAGIRPQDITSIDDLPKIPFCTKAELQADQVADPPFGSYVGVSRRRWARYAATSGTTGRPLRRVLSARDWQYLIDRFRRNPTAGPGDIAVVLGPVDGLIGPSISSESLAAMGVLVVQAGLYDTRTKIQLIRDLEPTIVSGTVSYLLHMIEVAAEMSVDLSRLGIRSVNTFGEPGTALAETRDRLKRGWGAQRVGDGYGMTEIFPLGGNCPHSSALHIASDLVATEIIDSETGTPLPAGEIGEAVFTNLVGDSQPLLRYRSRDIARLATNEACACGFTGARLEGSILGRVDDMIWFRGANVFPSAIEAAVRRIPDLALEYQIEISGETALPEMIVRAEALRDGLTAQKLELLHSRLANAIREAVRVSATVEILAPGTLPRPDGRNKMRRVIDRRKHRNNFEGS
jgi:phenylacetate-CoA ligase